jgi:ABC toxin-like protein/neuraminidase-like protein/virulence plasmid A protein
MNQITFPLTKRTRHTTVDDLQHALKWLLGKNVFHLPGNDWKKLQERVQLERVKLSYGLSTKRVVAMFQTQNQLTVTGEVDQPTALRLNASLEVLGAFLTPEPNPQRLVSGQVRRDDNTPYKGGRVRAFHQTSDGAVRLGEDITDPQGGYTIHYELLPGTTGINLHVSVTDDQDQHLQSSKVFGDAKILETIDLTIPGFRKPAIVRVLEGRIMLASGVPAEGLRLRLYRHDFGRPKSLVSETVTRPGGIYSFSYEVSGQAAASLEVVAVNASGAETPLSRTIHGLGAEATTLVNLVAPQELQPLASEFQRLTVDLTPHIGNMSQMANVRENNDRQDLTALNRTTGWDARLLALAANAAKLSADPDTGLSQEVLYGLFRAGLPSDKLQLAQLSAETLEQALTKVKTAGIVNLSDAQVADAKTRFQTFAVTTALGSPTPGSLSTYGQLLNSSGLSEPVRTTFAQVYLNHRGGDPDALWQQATAAGISAQDVQLLQQQGKLAFLTLNNHEVTARLQADLAITDPVQLVGQDFYRPDKWKNEIRALAGTDVQKLDQLIPPAYDGETVEDRLGAYAEDMARKVRLSYPTQVIGRMVEQDTSNTFKLDAARTSTATFLNHAANLGFKLGETPVEKFLKDQPSALNVVETSERVNVVENARALQRVYQITPSNEAMSALMAMKLTSAYDIAGMPKSVFLDRVSGVISLKDAELIYRKSRQVTSVTYNIFAIAKTLDSQPPVFGVSAPAQVKETAKSDLIKQFPTLESLFGSLDFCECEHCRSVLSPAAYLVDLLQFIDAEPALWDNFLADWKKKHNNQDYTVTFKKPYVALIERRPDIPHIPLTCENTHTALPYIDVVNEILEYYVANEKLDAKAAHDTGNATTAELLAEPQNVIASAYQKLREARYPLALPFDLWLETVRKFSDYFETPLWQLLETLRSGDTLFEQQPYDRAAIFIESLGLSPSEYAIFINPPLSHWYELYGYSTEADAKTVSTDATSGQRLDLNSAKALSRRLGVTYKELREIVTTGFVNPKRSKFGILNKLGAESQDALLYKQNTPFYEQNKDLLGKDRVMLSTDDKQRFDALTTNKWAQLKEVQAFETRLLDLSEEFQASGLEVKTSLNTALQTDFNDMLVLVDPDSGCNFDLTTLRYASGAAADGIAFLKINLFVRLWRRLGWTIEETDRALQAFIPKNTPFDVDHLDEQPLKTALIYMAHLKRLDEQVSVGKQSRLKLLTLWSQIATTGKISLYAQLFLTRSVLKNDPIFDDLKGNYLSSAAAQSALVKEHLPALQGALGMTADEIERALTDAGQNLSTPLSLDNAKLSLDNVSLLYRYGLLARALKLSVRELISLKQLSGLEPFNGLDPLKSLGAGLLTSLAEDFPFSQTLRFVEIAGQLKDSGLTIEDLEYLLRHRFDETGKYRPDTAATLLLIKTLADGIRAIRAEHAVPADPQAMTEQVLRQKLGLVLPLDVIERFLSMMNGTAEFTTEQARSFFDSNLKKQKLRLDDEAGFLDEGDFQTLFGPLNGSEQENQATLQARRNRVAAAFLPLLQRRLIRQFIIQEMTAQTGADAALVESLLTNSWLIGEPQTGAPATPLDALTAVAECGLAASFFSGEDGAGTALPVSTFLDAHTGLKDKNGNPLKPSTANSATFVGYLEVPAPGAYRFYVASNKQGTRAQLRFDHLPAPLLDHTATEAMLETSEQLTLKPGIPYRFTLDVKRLNGGDVRLMVQGETLPKDSLSQLALYPRIAVEGADHSLTLLRKVLQLSQSLTLSERELAYLLTHANDFSNLDLSKLPASTKDISPDGVNALFAQCLRLIGYARLKRDLAPGTDDLIDIFEASPVDEAYPQIAKLMRREEAKVRATAVVLFGAPSFRNELTLQRLWEALQVVERFGVPVSSLAAWTRIVSPTPTPNQRFAIARDLKEAIKARFQPEMWQRVAQPIFDRLRQHQRDALAAHVMHQHGFARMEQLYEYFLIDPGMEPVVQTSRIRLAISSLQLFIHRCLLNLEKQVHPSVINSKQWEWMKRYRVWEANRKIFLFPENWLEPEFRDDKTHLFRELEGNLLQGDVSNDLVEDAFLKYLRKLEELARLDIVCMHLADNPDPTLNVLHVIGRTYSTPHKYFYRRYSQQMWTAWEPVTTEIEGDHLAPVVWRDRLYLFWVTFMDKPNENPRVPISPDNQPRVGATRSNQKLGDFTLPGIISEVKEINGGKHVDMQLHWSEYLEGEWSPRVSGEIVAAGTPLTDLALSALLATAGRDGAIDMSWVGPSTGKVVLPLTVPLNFDYKKLFIHVSKEPFENGEERGVHIHIGGNIINQSFYLAGRNSQPEAELNSAPPSNPYSPSTIFASRYSGTGPLTVHYKRSTTTPTGGTADEAKATSEILGLGTRYTLLPCDNDITLGSAEIASLVKPVFYQDNQHTFFIEPALTERTIKEWRDWIVPRGEVAPNLGVAGVIPDVPRFPIPVDLGHLAGPVSIAPGSILTMNRGPDWLLNAGTGLLFNGEVIGPAGLAGVAVLPSSGITEAIAQGGVVVNTHAGSAVATGSAVIATDLTTLAQSGLTLGAGGLNVVGSSGLNQGILGSS